MKTVILISSAIVFSLTSFAQTDSSHWDNATDFDKKNNSNKQYQEGKQQNQNDRTTSQRQDSVQKDCVMMMDRKVVMRKNGKTVPLDKDMTMKNGSVVSSDGIVKMKDGRTIRLQEGECMDMSGKMIPANERNKMNDKNKEYDKKKSKDETPTLDNKY